tara:strand:- start:642 stop:875 length:234 start_codon:yes stop_codon:yes gene_type:complete
MNIGEKVRKVLSRNLECAPEKIFEGLALGAIKEWDSLKHIDIIVDIEEEFNLDLNSDMLVKMNSYEGIVEVIEECRK